MKNTIGIVYAISAVAGHACAHLVSKMAPKGVEVITFADSQIQAFQKAKLMQNKEDKINFIAATLFKGVETLAQNGAAVIILSANSVHIAFNKLYELTKARFPYIQILSILDAVASECSKYETVAIFGTNATIESGMYQEKLINEEVAFLPCEADDQAIINEIISSGYNPTTFPDNLRYEIRRIGEDLKNKGCQAIVLACTELPLLLHHEDYANLPYIDSNKVLAEYAIKTVKEAHIVNAD